MSPRLRRPETRPSDEETPRPIPDAPPTPSPRARAAESDLRPRRGEVSFNGEPPGDNGTADGAEPPQPPGPEETRAPAAPGARPPRRRPRLKKLRVALVVLGLSVLAFVSWIFGIMMAVAGDLPQLEDRAQFANAENSIVYDIHGNKVATLTNTEGRILVGSLAIAPVMKEATVAVEDRRFYEHRGVDFQGIGRAVVQDILHTGTEQGASTITQQFVKNALRAQDSRTVFEKLREAALAYHLERQWPKDKILTQYLNEIYFGNGAYGIEAAARTYFGWNHRGCGSPANRCASELFPWEAALLAGMISNPAGYDPKTNPDAALGRRNLVLQNMAEQGYITEADYDDYSERPLPPPSRIRTPEEDSRAPYFTSWLRQQVVDHYGAGEAFGGGLDITSTLDLPLQERVEQTAYDRAAGVGLDAAVVVLDNATGGVRAMVGGFDYRRQPFNLATQGHRQPGSAFKPFTLVTALEQGISPDQVFPSAPQRLPFRTQVPTKGGDTKVVNELFEVNNYEDQYLGSASLATATTHSDNSVYSQLGMRVGPANVAKTAHSMGIETDLATSRFRYSIGGGPFEPYNPALILGGLQSGVTPLEMAHAYLTLQHSGQLVSGTLAGSPEGPVAIQKVSDEPPGQEGSLIETNDGEEGQDRVVTEQVVSPEVAATARSILHTVVTQGTGGNAYTGDPSEWGKTGTTENNGDAWFVGATKEITVAVWVGHAQSVKPMRTEYGGGPVDGGTIPALIFNDVVTAFDELSPQDRADRQPPVTDAPAAPPAAAPAAPAPATTTPTTAAPSEEQPAKEQPQQQASPPQQQAPPPSDGGGAGQPGGGAPATGGTG